MSDESLNETAGAENEDVILEAAANEEVPTGAEENSGEEGQVRFDKLKKASVTTVTAMISESRVRTGS